MSSNWSWLKRQEKRVSKLNSFQMDSASMNEIVETADTSEAAQNRAFFKSLFLKFYWNAYTVLNKFMNPNCKKIIYLNTYTII